MAAFRVASMSIGVLLVIGASKEIRYAVCGVMVLILIGEHGSNRRRAGRDTTSDQ
jgi:hypothetical protein